MQQCQDYIEMSELKHGWPFHDIYQDARFAKQVRDFLGTSLASGENVTLQVKNMTQKERTGKHQDTKNCTWYGYTKTLGLCFMWKDAFREIWSLKILVNSRVPAGHFFDHVLKLKPILMRVKLQMQLLNQALENIMLKQSSKGEW